MNKYAIIDEAAGHLVNVVLWDGDLATWQPPAGTRAELLANVDLSLLPPKPEPEGEPITAEEAVSQYFSPYQIAALSRLEMALLQAGKPLGPQMTVREAVSRKLVMLGLILPRILWPQCRRAFPGASAIEQASAEAVSTLPAQP
jgi:hypothetical protein